MKKLQQNDSVTAKRNRSKSVGQGYLLRLGKYGGKSCRCRRGQLHGSYFYRVWRDVQQAGDKRGKVNKAYVKATDVAGVRARCAEYRVMEEGRRALHVRHVVLTVRLRVQVHRSRRLRLPA